MIKNFYNKVYFSEHDTPFILAVTGVGEVTLISIGVLSGTERIPSRYRDATKVKSTKELSPEDLIGIFGETYNWKYCNAVDFFKGEYETKSLLMDTSVSLTIDDVTTEFENPEAAIEYLRKWVDE